MAKTIGRLLALGVVTACSPTHTDSGVAVGSVLPVEWSAGIVAGQRNSAPGMIVIWAVTAADCLGCITVEPVLRRLHWEDSDVDLRVVMVGSTDDEEIVRRHLTNERLDVPITRVDRRAHINSHAGRWPLPLLLLIDQDTIVWAEGPNLNLASAFALTSRIDRDNLTVSHTAGTSPGPTGSQPRRE